MGPWYPCPPCARQSVLVSMHFMNSVDDLWSGSSLYLASYTASVCSVPSFARFACTEMPPGRGRRRAWRCQYLPKPACTTSRTGACWTGSASAREDASTWQGVLQTFTYTKSGGKRHCILKNGWRRVKIINGSRPKMLLSLLNLKLFRDESFKFTNDLHKDLSHRS